MRPEDRRNPGVQFRIWMCQGDKTLPGACLEINPALFCQGPEAKLKSEGLKFSTGNFKTAQHLSCGMDSAC